MKRLLFIGGLVALLTASCGLDKDDKGTGYEDWKAENDRYLADLEQNYATGEDPYTKIVPDWAPNNSVFIRWHNDRAETASRLKPLSNSTVNIKYEMEDINGTQLGNSYSSVEYGDSIYQSRPSNNIVGMWAAMINMHEGDSVTMIIPYISGYGARTIGSIRPYTNLIYHVKMTKVVDFEKP